MHAYQFVKKKEGKYSLDRFSYVDIRHNIAMDS